MKLNRAAIVLYSAGLVRSARPAAFVEDVIGTREHKCPGKNALQCQNSGYYPSEEYTHRYNCWGNWCSEETAPCTTECCASTKIDDIVLDNKCRCLHRDESTRDYSSSTYPGDPGGAYCCSHYSKDDHSKCACAPNGKQLTKHGAKKTDCCSQAWDGDKICRARDCVHAGSEPGAHGECCGYGTYSEHAGGFSFTEGLNDKVGGKCACQHYGQSPNTFQVSGAKDCCSGSFGPNKKCGCIGEGGELKLNAKATDCCSGKADDGHCLKEACAPPGAKKEKGAHCCSDHDIGGICTCVVGGGKLAADATHGTCCSGEADEHGVCTFLSWGDQPNKTVTEHPETACSSGAMDKKGQCTCVREGHDLSHTMLKPTQCCSGKVTKDTRTCACLTNGAELNVPGVHVDDCCSKASEEGNCRCALPGFPNRKGLGGSECCAGEAVEGHCGCNAPGTPATKLSANLCCGGLINVTTSKCRCIPAGVAVAKYVKESSCCDGLKLKDGVCAPAAK